MKEDQHWFCKVCRQVGSIEYEEEVGAYAVVELLRQAHQRGSIGCDNSNIQVVNRSRMPAEEFRAIMTLLHHGAEKVQKAFLVGTHRYSFQAGKPAEIIGVAIVTPEGLLPRLCFHLRFEDGREDYTPISESTFYEIISEEGVRAGRIPEVVH